MAGVNANSVAVNYLCHDSALRVLGPRQIFERHFSQGRLRHEQLVSTTHRIVGTCGVRSGPDSRLVVGQSGILGIAPGIFPNKRAVRASGAAIHKELVGLFAIF